MIFAHQINSVFQKGSKYKNQSNEEKSNWYDRCYIRTNRAVNSHIPFLVRPLQPAGSTTRANPNRKSTRIKRIPQSKTKRREQGGLEDQSQFDIDRATIITTVTAAFLAIVCGVISFLKREDLRYSATAAVIGGSALAFQFIIVAIVIAVILVLIVTVLNR